MKILGIDQSFKSTGFCIINEDESVEELGVIKTGEAMGDVYDRSYLIARLLASYIKQYNIKAVGIEGLAFNMIGNATRNLAGLQFVLITYFRSQLDNVDVKVIAPNSIKKFATKGDAKKQDMVDVLPKDVLKLIIDKGYKKTTGLYDITDAYWISRYTLDEYKKEHVISPEH